MKTNFFSFLNNSFFRKNNEKTLLLIQIDFRIQKLKNVVSDKINWSKINIQ